MYASAEEIYNCKYTELKVYEPKSEWWHYSNFTTNRAIVTKTDKNGKYMFE